MSSASKTTLGSFNNVVDGLARMSDESHIIVRFSQFLAESNIVKVPARRCTVILQFTEFPRDSSPEPSILIMFRRLELETLARTLHVSHHGHKTDISERIDHALREPLFNKPTAESYRTSAAGGTYGNSNQGNSYFSSAVNANSVYFNATQQSASNIPIMYDSDRKVATRYVRITINKCLNMEPTKNPSSCKQILPFPSSCTANSSSVE